MGCSTALLVGGYNAFHAINSSLGYVREDSDLQAKQVMRDAWTLDNQDVD